MTDEPSARPVAVRPRTVETIAPLAPKPAPPSPPVAQPISTEEIAAAVASLLTPAFALTFAVGLWRLGLDLGYTSDFFVTEGIWSHWQTWLALAGSIQYVAYKLNQRARQRLEPQPSECVERRAA